MYKKKHAATLASPFAAARTKVRILIDVPRTLCRSARYSSPAPGNPNSRNNILAQDLIYEPFAAGSFRQQHD